MSQFTPEDHQGDADFVSDGNITFESDRNQDGAGDIVFRTGGVERSRIKANGSGTGWANVLGGSITAVYNAVTQYGADPTGVVDSLAAINTAIGDCTAAGGGIVYLPPGTYKVTALIRLRSYVTLMGAGKAVTNIKATTGVAAAVLCGLSGDLITRWSVVGISVNGDYTTSALTIAGLQVTNGSFGTTRDFAVDNCGGPGMLMSATTDCEFWEPEVGNVGLAGLSTGHGIVNQNGSHRNQYHHPRVTGARGMGISLGAAGNGSNDVSIDEPYIDQSLSSTYECIGVTADCLRYTVTNPRLDNSQDNGISMSGAYGTLSGGEINGSVNHGVAVAGDHCAVGGGLTIRNIGSAHAVDGLDYAAIQTSASKSVYDGITVESGTTMSYVIKEVAPADNNRYGVINAPDGGWLQARSLLVGASSREVALVPHTESSAKAQGLLGQNFERGLQASTTVMIGGTSYAMLVAVTPGTKITNVFCQVLTAGSGTSLFKAGIYGLDGTTQYAVTADKSASFSATGPPTLALTAPWVVPAGVYAVYVVFVATATTTLPALERGSNSNAATKIGSGSPPFTNVGTGLTDLPAAPLTFAAPPSSGACYWVGYA